MSLEQDLKDDMSIFYDTDDFAKVALYKTNEIPYLLVDDEFQLEGADMVISCIASDVIDLKKGDVFTLGNTTYKCLDFDLKSNSDLEMIIGLIK